MLSQIGGFSSFSWLNNISFYIYHIFSIHSFIGGQLGSFRIFAEVNNAALTTGVQISLQGLEVFLLLLMFCFNLFLLLRM